MPELPEVETVRSELAKQIPTGDQLVAVDLECEKLRNPLRPSIFKKFLGRHIKRISRRSKYLLFEFQEGGGYLSHLGMTGHWRLGEKDSARRNHDHVRLHFGSGRVLIYNDPRRFGFFDAFEKPEDHALLKNLGPEPFSDEFSSSYLKSRLQGRKGPLKNLLMNQSLVAGIGNIYASEILFRAKIRPTRPAHRVKAAECETLVLETRRVLQESLQYGGSSFDDFRHVSGDKGGFQNRFCVYDRKGQGCIICGQAIRRRVQAGRSTFWCSTCQK
ncbi:MAG: bifunctional DNA-formamidopyrimidine glycosylase/DNA-(apurinic or apyrimidinic site) lyase [Bdellovibrionales bacterium]